MVNAVLFGLLKSTFCTFPHRENLISRKMPHVQKYIFTA